MDPAAGSDEDGEPAMNSAITISALDLQQAEAILNATDYWKKERSYKSAVHTVMAALLAPSSLADLLE